MNLIKLIIGAIVGLMLFVFFVKQCQEEGIYDGLQDYSQEEEFGINVEDCYAVNDSLEDELLATMCSCPFLSDIERKVIIEVNKCRINPRQYAEVVLVPFLNMVRSDGTYINSQGRVIMTKEGKSAVEEAIEALRSQRPKSMIEVKNYLCKAARDHCENQGPNGYTGHGGSDGSSPLTRVLRYKDDCGVIGENISYGPGTATEILCCFLIDDGVPDRGHRKNIFEDYSNIGVSIGTHKTYKYMCVLDFEL